MGKHHKIHTHPKLEKRLGLDDGHVIIDKEILEKINKGILLDDMYKYERNRAVIYKNIAKKALDLNTSFINRIKKSEDMLNGK